MISSCGDCAVEEGQLHEEGCDQERCPVCNRQLLSCPKHTWKDFKDEEREPYFSRGFSCKRCGDFFPNMLMVEKDQWEYICGCTYNKEDILCPDCMGFIKQKRDDIFKELGGNK